jgi:hypothetical protein
MITLSKGEKRMDNKNVSTGNGIGFCGVLTLIFITLKLIGIINWSWWWVLSPLWIPVAIALFIILIILVVKIFV